MIWYQGDDDFIDWVGKYSGFWVSRRFCVELVLFPFNCLVQTNHMGLKFSLWEDVQLNYLMALGLFDYLLYFFLREPWQYCSSKVTTLTEWMNIYCYKLFITSPFKLCKTYWNVTTVIPDIDHFSSDLAKFLSMLLCCRNCSGLVHFHCCSLFPVHVLCTLFNLYHSLWTAHLKWIFLRFPIC